MKPLVTIGIPVYKRLQYLPNVLEIVAAQDYPNIDLLISDNGENGTVIPDILAKHYHKPYRFRQNPSTVHLSAHFNQLIENAAGEYFVVLADDDEISPNYVSEMVSLLERNPQASVGMSVQETIDENGNVLSRSKNTVPELLSGPDFIRAAWETRQYGFRSFSTFLAKTRRLKMAGGFPIFRVACADEDILVVKLCLDNFMAFSTRCTFRKRFSESTDGYSAPIHELSAGIRDFVKFLNSDPQLREYGAAHPVQWRESKRYLVRMAWRHYYFLWSGMYRKRLSTAQWFAAAFELPFIPEYYKAVSQTFLSSLAAKGKQKLPRAYEIYRTVRPRRS